MDWKPVLTRSVVERILQAAVAAAQAQGWPVAIAVVDDGGHPLGMQRLDGCAPLFAYVALEKARTAALGRAESKAYEDIINSGRPAFLSVPAVRAILEGAVPIVVAGHVIGAVGVSGVDSDLDVQVAQAGVAAIADIDPKRA